MALSDLENRPEAEPPGCYNPDNNQEPSRRKRVTPSAFFSVFLTGAVACGGEIDELEVETAERVLVESAIQALKEEEAAEPPELQTQRTRRVRPILECVEKISNRKFRAHWGYNNPGKAKKIRVGRRNRFRPRPSNQGQPTEFQSGRVEDVFTTEFRLAQVWILDGKFATATRRSKRCEVTCDPAQCPDDGDACTTAACEGGACVQQPVSCEDDNPCTADSCDSQSGCLNEPVADGTSCGAGLVCVGGVCTGGCASNADCDDGNVCNGDEVCVDSQCQAGTPLSCGDGNACNGDEVCDPVSGCQPGTPLVCDDSNVCTADSCDAAAGCVSVPVEDGTSCGSGQVCVGGTCTTGCTVDSDCVDGNACNGTESCVNFVCQAGTPLVCDDGNACNGVENCSAAVGCEAGTPLNCDDGNVCTVNTCDAQQGCTSVNVADGTSCGSGQVCVGGVCSSGCSVNAECDDNNVCNGTETCVDFLCAPGTPLVCDDDNACNGAESCDPASGCQAGTPLVCDNNDVCDGAESCDPATGCQSGTPLECVDDGEPCTAEFCDEIVGCTFDTLADGTPCGGAGQTCQAGVCTAPPEPQIITVNHTFRGAFNAPDVVSLLGQPWKVIANSYQVRSFGDGAQALEATRNYFTFDLSGISGTVTAAEIRIAHPSNSYDSPDASETVELFDVSTESSVLQNPPVGPDLTPLEEIFGDLGSGGSFGTFEASLSDDGTVETIQLNGVALQNLNQEIAAGDGIWSIGGSLTTGAATAFGATERVFRGSDDSGGSGPPATELVLTVEPTVVSAADTGYFLRAFNAGGTTLQSFHFAVGDTHQTYFTGNQNIPAGDIERRAYFIFDLSGVGTVSAATLRIWAWAPALANGGAGAYQSPDPSETLGIFSLDDFTAADIQNAPFNQVTDHTVDVPIWTDLGDGTSYGSRVYTVADETTDLIPSPTAPLSTDCSAADAPCGRWLDVPLNGAAVSAISGASGLWAIGASVTTISGAASVTEWLNSGTLVDLQSSSPVFPEFLTPQPQLVVSP